MQVLFDLRFHDGIINFVHLGKVAVQIFAVNVTDAFNKPCPCHFVQFAAQFKLRRMGNDDVV